MATIHALQHTPTEGPATIFDVARALGHDVRAVRLYNGDPVPTELPIGDALLVLGGPMGVRDIGDARWPFLESEVLLLQRTLQAGQPVLGICLGAQLMAHALGARVYPLTVGEPPAFYREVGWGAVSFIRGAPMAGAILDGLHDSAIVIHWHGDTFDLPSGAVRLASTLACPNQMYSFGDRAFAIQFHVELTEREVLDWLTSDADFVRKANGLNGAARLVEETAIYIEGYRPAARRLLHNVFRAMFRT